MIEFDLLKSYIDDHFRRLDKRIDDLEKNFIMINLDFLRKIRIKKKTGIVGLIATGIYFLNQAGII